MSSVYLYESANGELIELDSRVAAAVVEQPGLVSFSGMDAVDYGDDPAPAPQRRWWQRLRRSGN